jgi:hypothetical protein
MCVKSTAVVREEITLPAEIRDTNLIERSGIRFLVIPLSLR